MKKNLLKIATIGKTVGLKGELKLHLDTDFPEQFHKGATFPSDTTELEIEQFNEERMLVKFRGYSSKEDASRLTNQSLYTTYEQTKEACGLEEDEYFWFDIIGCEIIEDGKVLGSVQEIERINTIDYLNIKTSNELVEQSLPKSFLIPYIDRYIIKVDQASKTIESQGAFEILEAS